MESPEHIAGLAGVTVTVGVGFTVMVWFAVALQPLVVPVTVYVVVEPGLALGLGQVVQLKPAAGAHV